MKTFTFRLEKTPNKKMTTALKRSVKTGVPFVREDEMLCGSVGAMMTVISRSKFEAFAAIVKHKPKTLNQLARLLEKDLGNISRDVRSLETIGLIELRRENLQDVRQVRPVAKYSQIAFDFSSAPSKTSTG